MKTKTPNVSGRSAWLRDNITKYFSFSAIIILLVALSLTQDNFLGTSNLKNLLRDTAPLMIMSAGMTMVLLFGSIDLSMGAVCSVSNVTYIHLMLAFQDSFSNPLLTSLAAMAVSLAFGLASGLALGIIHVKLKVPSFIASLGFMSLWQSVALLITQNPESVPKALWGTVEWYKIAFGVVGLPLIVAIAIILFIHCVTRYTPSGRTILPSAATSALPGWPVWAWIGRRFWYLPSTACWPLWPVSSWRPTSAPAPPPSATPLP